MPPPAVVVECVAPPGVEPLPAALWAAVPFTELVTELDEPLAAVLGEVAVPPPAVVVA